MTKAQTGKLLVDRDNPVLRDQAVVVSREDITSTKIQKIIAKMKKALHAEDDGVAIAAPQIGEGLRIFVVNGDALAIGKEDKIDPSKELKDLVFINPEIIKTSRKKQRMEEGCLSLRYLYGQVDRHEKVTITAYDEHGHKGTHGASGLLSQIFQHEIDHLNGVLFIDKAMNVQDIPPQHND